MVSKVRSFSATALGRARASAHPPLAADQLLRDAIEALPQGIVFLDKDGRYILWNRRYAEFYQKSADLFKPGARLIDTLRMGVARGDYPEAEGREEEWLAERTTRLNNPGERHEQWLSDGRCILIEERRTAQGGTIGLRVDITEMKRREESFRLLFESNPAPMFVYAPETGIIAEINATAADHFGLDRNAARGMSAQALFSPEEWEDARMALRGAAPIRDRIWRQQRSDGGQLESILFARETGYGESTGQAMVVCVFDVTEQRRAEARIAHMARHDELTGLANRSHCREALQAMLLRAGQSQDELALLAVDLDFFKAVNDTFGHPMGDALLRRAAQRMVAALPEGVLVARMGGDEFAIVLPGRLGVTATARALVEAMAQPFVIEDQTIHIGATIGIAISPTHACDAETLIRFADLALYAAKSEQRGSVVLFEREMDAAARDRRQLERDLREAVQNGKLEVHYQPLIDLQSGRVEGYEALLRWNDPLRGAVPPDQFIPLAEETGLIDAIGQFVLNSACAQAVTWPEGTRIAVNVSPVQLRNANLLGIITQALAASGLAPERLEIEITEAVLIEKNPQVAATMQALRALGVGMSMDDFGTGYSSLSYLLSYPFTKIKIDKSFVNSLDTKPNSQAIVKAIIGLGERLGMKVTAEGIEQSAVLDYLRREGCAQGQGYLFGAARPAGEWVLPQAATEAA
ncbi:MAG: EAL domain-containing protein [Sphingomonadales bacterium]|nr:EAL domain-containing protein [Sphingomonadales bacterium]MDE2171309.1 EAL domain-containing protein [Sphingomonadales bacterium]